MRPRLFVAVMVLVVVAGMVSLDLRPVHAGEEPSTSGYKVLDPIRHGSLTVFPVVAPRSYATGEFLTLDEGLRSGEVVVTEYGNVRGLMRRGPTPAVQAQVQSAAGEPAGADQQFEASAAACWPARLSPEASRIA